MDGRASFVGPHDVLIENGGSEPFTIHAEKIFINTGSLPRQPAIEGAQDSRRIFTSTSLMQLQQLPRDLVIFGGGYIGLEFASIYAAFGSRVTVVEKNDVVLPQHDRDIADAVRSALETQGIRFLLGASVERVRDDGDFAWVTVADGNGAPAERRADAILIAVGRAPNVAGLGLDRAGVQVDERGFIVVDEYLCTTAPHIWALGDVNGGPQFTYISLDDYRIVRDQLDGRRAYSTKERRFVPFSVFIHPTLSWVGLTEEEALRNGHSVQIVKLAAAAVPRAQQLRATEGLLKAVIDT